MTKRLTAQEKRERKPTPRACVFCHSKHLQCSHSRPCQNCIKRNVAHQCRDVVRKRAKYMSNESHGDMELEPEPESAQRPVHPITLDPDNGCFAPGFDGSLERVRDSPMSTSTNTTTTTTTTNFNSNILNQEYLMLGDLISKPLSPLPYMTSMLPMVMLLDLDTENPSRPFIAVGGEGHDSNSSRLSSPDIALDFSASDKAQYVSPLISHHIYQTVQDIYANKVIDFDYPLSYHLLTFFLRERFLFAGKALLPEDQTKKKTNLLIILRLIASYRPTFISAHKSLFQPFDFQFLEMSFQRCLLDYENLLRLNALPTIIWRRTGEIVSMSNDLVNLLGLNISTILSKRTFIMELMYDDESIVDYFRLFKLVAVGNLHLTIVTRCKLIRHVDHQHVAKTNTSMGNSEFIEFCSAWTVKRDLFDLPMMIVGQFLPILPTTEGFRTY